MACTVELKVKGQTLVQIITKNVELDKAIDDKIFAAPADLAKPADKK
jgi:hypothetical protein